MEKLKAQEGEGCHMWGTLAVNKVRCFLCQLIISACRYLS